MSGSSGQGQLGQGGCLHLEYTQCIDTVSCVAPQNRQLRGSAPSDGPPVLYDVALLSPRALADSLGAASFETDAAVSALAKLASNVQRSLQSLHGDRCADCSDTFILPYWYAFLHAPSLPRISCHRRDVIGRQEDAGCKG